jgi:hypothetical protein
LASFNGEFPIPSKLFDVEGPLLASKKLKANDNLPCSKASLRIAVVSNLSHFSCNNPKDKATPSTSPATDQFEFSSLVNPNPTML